jgi:predicted transcriptional regulator of viral defense system
MSVPRPDWNRLYEIAAGQEGHFTTQQAGEVGYSPQLLAHHVRLGKFLRVRRGVYRVVHYPPGEHEELVALWLWAELQGTFSHQTALALHGLSDVLPAKVHLTLPAAWRRRRLRVPQGVVLHYSDRLPSELRWVGSVPVTSPVQTLKDCAQAHLSPELLRQASGQVLARGLASKAELAEVERALTGYGGAE